MIDWHTYQSVEFLKNSQERSSEMIVQDNFTGHNSKSLGSESPLQEEKKEDTSFIETLTEDQKKYLSFLQRRLFEAKQVRDTGYEEFGGKSYITYYNENEKIANTILPPKKNRDDVEVSAGTVESKLDAILSHIGNLNLSPEVFSFVNGNNRLRSLGTALKEIILETEEREVDSDMSGDEEKKLIRQRQLLKQGTVFVQEQWAKRHEIEKKLNTDFDGDFNFSDWEEEIKVVFEGPIRSTLYGPSVYLGDITQFYMENQPFIFTVKYMDYEQAKSTFQKFGMWKYVKKGAQQMSSISDNAQAAYQSHWSLTQIKDNQVEITEYQANKENEYQLLINGVPMFPIGFPLSAVSPTGGYSIAKQSFRILNDQFAYGGSFVSSGSVKEISSLMDEMLRLFVLKGRKSFTPAYVNTSGKYISSKALTPGRISMGIDPGALQPIASNETQGITAGELGVFKELQELINKSTVSPQFAGQQGNRGMTATEVLQLQQQAKLTLGLAVLSCSLLEKKISYLRLHNILANWFNPIDTRVIKIGDIRQEIPVFRSVNRESQIEGEGMGERRIFLQNDALPSPRQIRDEEIEEEKRRRIPVRKMFISPEQIKNAKILWYITINPREKESSPFFKLLFREMLNDAMALMQLGARPNIDGLEEEFSLIHNKEKNKFFSQRRQEGPNIAGTGTNQVGGRSGEAGAIEIPASPTVG